MTSRSICGWFVGRLLRTRTKTDRSLRKVVVTTKREYKRQKSPFEVGLEIEICMNRDKRFNLESRIVNSLNSIIFIW